MPLIELENISKIYGIGDDQVAAVKNISLSIERGEFAAIAGASGSGKSTLMNIMGCLDIPTSGKYRLCGEDISALSDKKLAEIRNRDIGFVFQFYNLIPNLTALENVELPLIYRGIPQNIRRQLAVHALEKVSLSSRKDHLPGKLSGGQQQRVAIARAIAASPPMILADEPTGNLDSRNSAEVMKILYDLNSQGKTVVMITHDDDIAAHASRTIRISDGLLVSDKKYHAS